MPNSCVILRIRVHYFMYAVSIRSLHFIFYHFINMHFVSQIVIYIHKSKPNKYLLLLCNSCTSVYSSSLGTTWIHSMIGSQSLVGLSLSTRPNVTVFVVFAWNQLLNSIGNTIGLPPS